jgi:hypothetical protein
MTHATRDARRDARAAHRRCAVGRRALPAGALLRWRSRSVAYRPLPAASAWPQAKDRLFTDKISRAKKREDKAAAEEGGSSTRDADGGGVRRTTASKQKPFT